MDGNKNVENIVSCNCARTSYYGEYCDEDNGAYFAGNSILVLNTAEIFEKVIFDWNEIDEQTFSFAFSTTKTAKTTKQSKPQILAAIHFKHNKIMQILLCKNGSINIGIMSNDVSFVYTFPYNYNDGYRHYFHARFRTNKSLKITIDSWKYDFPSDLAATLSLAYAVRFAFGGPYIADISDIIKNDKKTLKYNYTGCLSNIDIDVNVARIRLKPILYLYKSEFEFAESVTIIGNRIQLGACNSFLIPGSLPPILNTVTAPVWDSPFVTEPYQRINDNEDDNDGVGETEFSSKDPENSPLLPINHNDDKQSLVIENDFALPEPDQQLDMISDRNADDLQSNQKSITNSCLTTEMIDNNQSADNSRANNDDDNGDTNDNMNDIDFDDTLINCMKNDNLTFNLDRNLSQRSSTFKCSDSTAPSDSPLYKPPTIERKKLKSVPSPCSPEIQ
ncbi:BMA-ITX-1 [Dirofilaria immitis]|nr:BMA-ITX-1 [Dirofilaria immitis]